jgi:hypothetical protein
LDWLIDELKFELEKVGLKVFSPMHDVGFSTKKGFIATMRP